MRHLGVLAALVALVALATTACEHRPPREAPEPSAAPVAVQAAPSPTAPPPPPPPSPPPPRPSPPPPSPPPENVSPRCLAIGEHVADVLIADTTDATQKAAYTHNRAQLILRSAEGCTRDAWTDDQLACYQAARTVAALRACAPQPS